MKWFIAALILATVLVAGCTQSNSISSALNPNQCPIEDNLKNCISISAKNGSFSYNEYYFTSKCNLTENYTLLSLMAGNASELDFNCVKGSETGQNLNYFYCQQVPSVYISKDVVSPEGVIQEKLRYYISNLVLNSTYDVVELECQKSQLVD